jgi:hypothetical protein
MPRITISYRREDSGAITGRIFDRLATHYGRDAVFRDIDNIPLGVDFRQHVGDALGASDVVLAIVGPHWIGALASGNRLDDEADPVRIEIEATLRKGILLIPVLVLGATMPRAADLPASLKDFAYRNAVQIDTGQDFDVHMARLIRAVDTTLGLPDRAPVGAPAERSPPTSRRRFQFAVTLRFAITLAIIAVVGIPAAGWFVAGRRFDASKPATIVAAIPPPVVYTTPPARPAAPATPSSPAYTPQPAAALAPPPASPEKTAAALPPTVDAELVFWQSISTSGNAADFTEYLNKYPDGRFAGLARNRVAALTPSTPSRATCGGTDEQIMQPVKLLYQAVNTKNLNLYAAQWSDDGRYVDVTTGVTHTKAEKIAERRTRFAAWETVSLTMDRGAVTQRAADRATIEIIYSMIVKSYGHPAHRQTGVSERYDVVCGGDGRWLIQANIDENR